MSIGSMLLLSACSENVIEQETQAQESVEVASTEWVDDQMNTVDAKATAVHTRADALQKEINVLLASTNRSLFKDVSSDYWSYSHIKSLYEKQIISGYRDGTFKPEVSITRYQAASMLVKTFNLPLSNSPYIFKDSVSDSRVRQEMMTAYEAGFFKGNNGYFDPSKPMKRHHMAMVLQRAFKLTDNGVAYTPFPDVPQNLEAYEAIKVITQHKISTGSKGMFQPDNATTRAQFAAFVDRALPYK